MSSGAVNVGIESGKATVVLNNSILSHPLETNPIPDLDEIAGSTSSGTGNFICTPAKVASGWLDATMPFFAIVENSFVIDPAVRARRALDDWHV